MSGGMTGWDEISCQRGHEDHDTREVVVTIGGPTRYTDLPSIPWRFADTFEFEVWDTKKYPVDDGPWCPAHDAVSETIISHGVWEPSETILMLEAFRYCDVFIDIGAQIGWYSTLAARWSLDVLAIEADPVVAEVCAHNIKYSGGGPDFQMKVWRVDEDTYLNPSQVPEGRLAVKIDIEGAEADAVAMLGGVIDRIDFMLIEVSPVFNLTYPDLVAGLIERGFDAYLVPTKERPPARLEILPDDLERWNLGSDLDHVRETVGSWHQQNVLFVRHGAW